MNTTCEDTGLRRRAKAFGREHGPDVNAPPHGIDEPLSRLVLSRESNRHGSASERGNIVRRVASSSRHDFSRVVVEDEDRSLAGDSRDIAVNELVDD